MRRRGFVEESGEKKKCGRGDIIRKKCGRGEVFEFRAARRKLLEKASKRILIGRLVLGLVNLFILSGYEV